MAIDSKDNLHCSFCGKGQKEVKKLIAGPTVYTVSYTHLTLPTKRIV